MITLFYFLSLFFFSSSCLNVQFLDPDYDSPIVINNDQISEYWNSNQTTINEFENLSIFVLEPSETQTLGEIQLIVDNESNITSPQLNLPLYDYDAYYYYYENINSQIQLLIYYNCQKQGISTLNLVIPIKIKGPEGENITKQYQLSWSKFCGSGVRFGFQIGTTAKGNDVVDDGETKPLWKSNGVVVPSFKTFTSFFLSMKKGFGTQTYISPNLYSSNPQVLIRSRGYASISNSISVYDYSHEFNILYECKGTVNSTIEVRIEIPPYNPLIWSWEKVCEAQVYQPNYDDPNGINSSTEIDIPEVDVSGSLSVFQEFKLTLLLSILLFFSLF